MIDVDNTQPEDYQHDQEPDFDDYAKAKASVERIFHIRTTIYSDDVSTVIATSYEEATKILEETMYEKIGDRSLADMGFTLIVKGEDNE